MSKPIEFAGEWRDHTKSLPYFDDKGRFQLPIKTQRRPVIVNGKWKWQYREREIVGDEIYDHI